MIVEPIISNNESVKIPISTILSELDSNIDIEIVDSFKNVVSYSEYKDIITGDIEYFKIFKEFKYSNNNVVFSEWITLSDNNLNSIPKYEDIYFKFRYYIEPFQDNYDISYPIYKKPNIEGVFEAYNFLTNEPLKIEKDYPSNGEIVITLGYGNNGDYHIDTSTNKLYVKQNGYWTGGIKYTIQGSNYIPVKFNNQILSDAFIESVSSKLPIIPINDFILDIGTDIWFDTIDKDKIPKINDSIFINPLYQGIELTGYEKISITYSYSIVTEPKIDVKELSFRYETYLPSTDSIFCLVNINDQITYKPPFLLKLFSISSLSISVNNDTCSETWNPCLDVKFRYSFNSRNWQTGWIPLSLENLKCIKPNPLKFFYIEFLFTKICDTPDPLCVNDLIINGNIQNVSNDSKKLNRFGLRSDCDYNQNETLQNGEVPVLEDPNICKTAPTFNPYNLTKPTQFLEKLTTDVSDIFGWTVDYYRVVPNDSGIDYVLHEYGTMDIVDKQPLKILVPDNKFPEDQISFNSFDMSLFDNFEIHITKQEFYSKFGLGNRPAKEDYLFICQINKFFKVEHAQSFRDFNNSALFFKVSLTKKSDDKDISANNDYATDFAEMIKSSTLDSLIGHEVQSEVDKIANTSDLQNLTEIKSINTKIDTDITIIDPINTDIITDLKKPDPIMQKVKVKSIEQDIENSTTIIARNYYDLMSNNISIGKSAIIYGNVDNEFDCTCCNKAITIWFNIYKYEAGMVYNLINNHDNISTGYRIDFIDGNLRIKYFDHVYNIDVHLSPKIWFGIIVNFNNLQKELEVFIYKRKSEHSCINTDLLVVDSHKEHLNFNVPTKPIKTVMSIDSSYLYMTNIRVWSELIPESEHMFVLNQNVVRNTEHIILSDNANKNVISRHHKF